MRGTQILFGFCDIDSTVIADGVSNSGNTESLELSSYVKFGVQIIMNTSRTKIEINLFRGGGMDGTSKLSLKDNIVDDNVTIRLVKGKSYKIREDEDPNVVRWRYMVKIGNSDWIDKDEPFTSDITNMNHGQIALALCSEKKNEPTIMTEQLKLLNLFSDIKGVKYYDAEGYNYRYETVSLIKK